MVRGEFAERVAGGGAHMRRHFLFRDGPHRRAVREQRGLGVVRVREFVGGALEGEGAEARAKGRIRAVPDVARGWKDLSQVLRHAGLLRALAGE